MPLILPLSFVLFVVSIAFAKQLTSSTFANLCANIDIDQTKFSQRGLSLSKENDSASSISSKVLFLHHHDMGLFFGEIPI